MDNGLRWTCRSVTQGSRRKDAVRPALNFTGFARPDPGQKAPTHTANREIPGGQEVAGSNPASPTTEVGSVQRDMLGRLLATTAPAASRFRDDSIVLPSFQTCRPQVEFRNS